MIRLIIQILIAFAIIIAGEFAGLKWASPVTTAGVWTWAAIGFFALLVVALLMRRQTLETLIGSAFLAYVVDFGFAGPPNIIIEPLTILVILAYLTAAAVRAPDGWWKLHSELRVSRPFLLLFILFQIILISHYARRERTGVPEYDVRAEEETPKVEKARALIPAGYKVLTIFLFDLPEGTQDWLTPGVRVDLSAAVRQADGSVLVEKEATDAVFLAYGREREKKPGGFLRNEETVFTFALKPEEVSKVIEGQHKGMTNIYLASDQTISPPSAAH